MKTKPILFNTQMVQALLDGKKTMTRRAVKNGNDNISIKCPYGKKGDLLWVREAIRKSINPLTESWGVYVADGTEACDAYPWKNKTLPSMFMPKGLSRFTLEITDIKVERLNDISEEDARVEGIEILTNEPTYKNYINNADPCGTARGSFRSLWQSINGKESLETNPWVWAIEFKVHKINVDEFLRGGGL